MRRELKRALESYWAGRADGDALLETARGLRRRHWLLQKEAGIDVLPSNDFSLYDHILDMALAVGAIPDCHGWDGVGEPGLDILFAMARGTPGAGGATALEMTKWFDTNYHYLVPEFHRSQSFRLASRKAVREFAEARDLGLVTRPVLPGPVTFLMCGKTEQTDFDRFELLESLVEVYAELLSLLADEGAAWVQLDEPCLVTDVPERECRAFRYAYDALRGRVPELRFLVATYFGGVGDNADLLLSLPVDAVHLDAVRGGGEIEDLLPRIPAPMMLSLGLVDGRNVWRTDLEEALGLAERAAERLGLDRLMLAPSCSLLHTPVDLDLETDLDGELRSWMAFAKQKLLEIRVLTRALEGGRHAAAEDLEANRAAWDARWRSPRIHRESVRARTRTVTPSMAVRDVPFVERKKRQQAELRLPELPTTTIGSFPQTREVRKARADHRAGRISAEEYEAFLRSETERAVRIQEETGLDVLVHGEFERNDMVEYFGERLEGFARTRNGWVQSYGSRCVKPPIIFGDVERTSPMTVQWWTYAQSLTERPMKGMLTGPVTILQWSFVRDDQPRAETARQIALALRDETTDLEAAGCRIIQIDEPALREGLPLRRGEWDEYLDWAVESFRLASSGVAPETQIHTHMCYCEFNDILPAIAALDADVISIEAARSRMELLEAFRRFEYPNDIGPGVYDIHTPRIPTVEEIRDLIRRAMRVIPRNRLWVNPDCGLKTRSWNEVVPALRAMTEAARSERA